MSNPNGIAAGDTIYVEQAWEDQTGAYHDEYAKVLTVNAEGEMTLDFGHKDLNDWLDGCTWNAADYEPEPLKP